MVDGAALCIRLFYIFAFIEIADLAIDTPKTDLANLHHRIADDRLDNFDLECPMMFCAEVAQIGRDL